MTEIKYSEIPGISPVFLQAQETGRCETAFYFYVEIRCMCIEPALSDIRFVRETTTEEDGDEQYRPRGKLTF